MMASIILGVSDNRHIADGLDYQSVRLLWLGRGLAGEQPIEVTITAVESAMARGAGLGRLHSVTNGWFREAKLQWRLYGDELGEG